jgi:hypothetical protein
MTGDELPPLLTIVLTQNIAYATDATSVEVAAVQRVLDAANADPTTRIQMYGHAEAGERAGVAKLRVDAVVQRLVAGGISPDRIAAESSIAGDRQVTINVVK